MHTMLRTRVFPVQLSAFQIARSLSFKDSSASRPLLLSDLAMLSLAIDTIYIYIYIYIYI